MRSIGMIVCVVMACAVAQGQDTPRVLIECSNCWEAVPAGATCVSGTCKIDVGGVGMSPDSLRTTSLPDEKVYAGSCSNPQAKSNTKTLTFGKTSETKWTITGGLTAGWSAGWKIEGSVSVGWTGTWGESLTVQVNLDSYSPGNAEIETTYSLNRLDWSNEFIETRKGWMMCHYHDASPDANFLVFCPIQEDSHRGEPGFTVISREKGTRNVCSLPPISGLCDQ